MHCSGLVCLTIWFSYVAPPLIGLDWTGMGVHHILDPGSVWYGQDGCGSAPSWIGLVWTGVDHPGLDWDSMHCPVLVCAVHNRSYPVWTDLY